MSAFDDPDLRGCAGIVERGDPDRFAATMAAPVAARVTLFPIYAFNIEVARAPWVTKEAMIAEMRLQWWRDALSEIAAGGLVRRHEVVTPLAMAVDTESAQSLDALVTARQWDIYNEPFEDAAALDAYLYATGGQLMLAAARSLGAVDAQVALEVGYAGGLAGWLRAIPQLEAQGRKPLVDGRAEAVADLARRGLERLDSARASGWSKTVRPAFQAAYLARPILTQAANDPRTVADGNLGLSDFARRARLLRVTLTGAL